MKVKSVSVNESEIARDLSPKAAKSSSTVEKSSRNVPSKKLQLNTYVGKMVRSKKKTDQLVKKFLSTPVQIELSRNIQLSYQDMVNGVPASAISESLGKGLTRDDIRMVIPDRTLERRIAVGAPLKIEEADGIARLARVMDHARRALGDERLANLWLRNPNPALENRVPIQMARTDLGGREVEAVLYRMEYGVFS